jgi:hypothetical protein
VEVRLPFDLQIRMRKSRSGADTVRLGVRAGADSTLLLSREEKLPQGKAADKS